MLHLVVAAGLQNIVESNQIALHIGVRIGDGVADPGLCGQINHYCYPVVSEYLLYCLAIGYTLVHKFPIAAERVDFIKPGLFDSHVVIVSYRVDSDYPDIFIIRKQPLDEVTADKTGRSCHEDGLPVKVYIVFKHSFV